MFPSSPLFSDLVFHDFNSFVILCRKSPSCSLCDGGVHFWRREPAKVSCLSRPVKGTAYQHVDVDLDPLAKVVGFSTVDSHHPPPPSPFHSLFFGSRSFKVPQGGEVGRFSCESWMMEYWRQLFRIPLKGRSVPSPSFICWFIESFLYICRDSWIFIVYLGY